MAIFDRQVVGVEYLTLVTEMLQRARRANPSGGVWEAADLQWWWRRDQQNDPRRQILWFEAELPVAAVVLTDWGNDLTCNLLSADHDISPMIDTLWAAALDQIEPYLDRGVEVFVREDNPLLRERVLQSGFEPTGYLDVTTWMSVSERREVGEIPKGFQLVSRHDNPSGPHHMVARNGERVAELLAECSLYRPELDLAIYAPSGDLAGYGLFWADPETRVGLVEPMRTEDEFQQMGVARHLLAAGLERLAQYGCSHLKVTYVEGNEAARRLYLGAGFRPACETRSYKLQRT